MVKHDTIEENALQLQAYSETLKLNERSLEGSS